jgi:hypothetical protein
MNHGLSDILANEEKKTRIKLAENVYRWSSDIVASERREIAFDEFVHDRKLFRGNFLENLGKI